MITNTIFFSTTKNGRNIFFWSVSHAFFEMQTSPRSHPGGMLENSPAFQRRDSGQRETSPGGTVEKERVSRLFGTCPVGYGNPALKRRAIIVCPFGTETDPIVSKSTYGDLRFFFESSQRFRQFVFAGLVLSQLFLFG